MRVGSPTFMGPTMPAASHVFQVLYVHKVPYACGVPYADEIPSVFGVTIGWEPPTSLMLTLQKLFSAGAQMLQLLCRDEAPAGSSANTESFISE